MTDQATDRLGGIEETRGSATAGGGPQEELLEVGPGSAEGVEQPPAEEFKLVVTLKNGQGVVSVQQTGTDPVFETFGGVELQDLILAAPGVVQRAQAQWTRAPRYPEYQPPPRPQGRQRQGSRGGTAANEDGENTVGTDGPQQGTMQLL